jgi:hypothetical protein
MNDLPTVISDIIYEYVHNLNMNDLLLEMSNRTKRCNQCDSRKIVIKRINEKVCHKCHKFICKSCGGDLCYDCELFLTHPFEENYFNDDDYDDDFLYEQLYDQIYGNY